jgi:hypothetical protein
MLLHILVGDRQVCRFGWNCSSIQICTPNGHLHRVTYTRYRINPYPPNVENNATKWQMGFNSAF